MKNGHVWHKKWNHINGEWQWEEQQGRRITFAPEENTVFLDPPMQDTAVAGASSRSRPSICSALALEGAPAAVASGSADPPRRKEAIRVQNAPLRSSTSAIKDGQSKAPPTAHRRIAPGTFEHVPATRPQPSSSVPLPHPPPGLEPTGSQSRRPDQLLAPGGHSVQEIIDHLQRPCVLLQDERRVSTLMTRERGKHSAS